MTVAATQVDLAIEVKKLCFSYSGSDVDGIAGEQTLEDIDLVLPQASRCLLIGANGSGKSTLLRILAGKKLTKTKTARIMGQDVFMNPPGGVVYLGTEWANNPVIRSDIGVAEFLDSVGGYRHAERRDVLLDLLDVDLEWRMHQISDGERRRVQLCMGLMGNWNVLLLDEVTVDLDALVRAELLAFLVKESKERNATIVYATHIYDHIETFPTHICHLRLGTTPDELVSYTPSQTIMEDSAAAEEKRGELMGIALKWLKADRDVRKQRDKERGTERGAKRGVTKDAKTFYEKYDYNAGKY